jgi:flagellar biosynthesis protein FlhF
MRIKRVDAPTVAEALRLLRQELGENALILHTKTITAGGVTGLFRRPRVEIIGAVDEPGFPASFQAPAPDADVAQSAMPSAPHASAERTSDGRRDAIAERLARFRAAVPAVPIPDSPAVVVPTTADAPLSVPAAEAPVAVVSAATEWDRVGHRARRVAFVGPTGAGKTTTLAKVAARARIEHGRRVALITIDTYRIGAVPQLASYAEILGVPLAVARTPDELVGAIDRAKEADLVFIDTIGRSPLGSGVGTLRPFLEAAAPDLVHLVVSATTRPSDSIRAASSFAALGTNRLCVTKLDETEDREAVSLIADAIRLPVSWLGVGQEVPDDLEEATPDRIASLVKGGRAA